MNRRTNVAVLLAALNALVAGVWMYTIDPPHGSELLSGIGFALMFGQAGLAGMWITMGRGPAPWRFGLTMIGATAATRLTQLWATSWPFGSVFLGATLVTAAGSGYLRLFGLRTVVAEPTDGARREAPEAPGCQFSLRALLEWTVAIALALALLRTLWLLGGPAIVYAIGAGGLLALGQVVVLPWALLVTLSPRNRAIGTVLLTLGYVAGFAIALSIASSGAVFALAVAIPAHAGYTLGSLWLVRQAGYRLAWPQAVTARQR